MAMGFDAADAGANAIRVHKEVKQPKPLTDRGKIMSENAEYVLLTNSRSMDTNWPHFACRSGTYTRREA